MRLTIEIAPLVRFFDEKLPGRQGHATALVALFGEDLGVALLADYLRRKGRCVDVYRDAVTTGARKGPRLDRWVKVTDADQVLYQVEVKNSSAYAIGGESLPWLAPPEVVQDYKRRRWNHIWDAEHGKFNWGANQKVLTRMRLPAHFRHLPLEPLICFWDAIHPTGANEAFFVVQAKIGDFSRVSVFSMSAYLRGLNEKRLILEMPVASERLALLRSMIVEEPGESPW